MAALNTEPSLAARLRDWTAIFVMLSSAPSLALIFTAVSPVLPLIAAHFGGHDGKALALFGLTIDGPLFAQLISTLPSIGLMLGGGPTGLAIDRFGARRVMVLAILAFAAFGSAGLYLEDAGLLLLSRLLLGFAAVGYAAGTVSLIGARFADRGRARALSFRLLLGGVGGLISTIVAGQAGEAGGWRAPFALYLAALAIVPLALVSLPARSPSAEARQSAGARESLRFLWPIYLSIVALAVVMMMNTAQLSFLLAANGITSPAQQSRVMVVGSTMAMAGAFLYAAIGPRLGARWNYTLIAAALGLGVVVMGLSHDAVATAVGAGLTGLGAGLFGPHFGRLVLARAPVSARGRAIGLYFSSTYFGDLINPFILHPLTVALGIHRAFLLVGGVTMASALQIIVPAGRRSAKAPVPDAPPIS